MENIEQYSDEELLERYREDGDPRLIGALFQRHQYIVLGICLRYLKDEAAAEDALMDIFEYLMATLRTAEVRSFRPWLGTVTRNHLHRHYRQQSRVRVELYEDESEIGGGEVVEFPRDGTLRDEWEITEMRENRLHDAIARLNPQQQQCIRMFYLEKSSYSDICDRTGYSFKEVKSYIQNGRRNLKIILGESFPDD